MQPSSRIACLEEKNRNEKTHALEVRMPPAADTPAALAGQGGASEHPPYRSAFFEIDDARSVDAEFASVACFCLLVQLSTKNGAK